MSPSVVKFLITKQSQLFRDSKSEKKKEWLLLFSWFDGGVFIAIDSRTIVIWEDSDILSGDLDFEFGHCGGVMICTKDAT